MIRFFTLFIFFFYSNTTESQSIVEGIVSSVDGKPLQNSNVVVAQVDSIITYAITDAQGRYSIELNSTLDSLKIIFSHIGYLSLTKDLELLDKAKNTIIFNIQLSEKSISLQEVILEQKRPIRVRKDTISIQVKKYADGNERNIEELLRKIPGINVDGEGTIKIGNQEIEQLLVDGDDLFDKGYKVLSKNMPSYIIEEVEILKNFSKNTLLKDFDDSNQVAINLKIQEDLKRIWFGNVNLGYGLFSENRYEAKVNLMNFGKKNKYYFLTSLNNIGHNTTGDIDQLIQPSKGSNERDIGDNQQIHSFTSLQNSDFEFVVKRANFNNDELLSFNGIFNPSDKLKVKTLLFFNNDERNLFKSESETINTADIVFSNAQDYTLRNNNQSFFGKLNLIYTPNKNSKLESQSKVSSRSHLDNARLLFNGNQSREKLDTDAELFDQKIIFTKKFENKNALVITGRVIREKSFQDYFSNQDVFRELFEINGIQNVQQNLNNQYFFGGINTKYVKKVGVDNLLEVQLGNVYRKDELESNIGITEGNNSISNPEGYANELNYSINDLFVNGKYKFSTKKKLSVTGRLEVHKIDAKVERLALDNCKTFSNVFINPAVELDLKINAKNRINTSFAYNNRYSRLENVYNNYILTGTRFFKKGQGEFNQLSGSTFILNYQLGNWTDRVFVNSFIIYKKSNDYFSTNIFLNPNYTLSETILLNGQEFLNIESNLDYYFQELASNLRIGLAHSESNFQNVVNSSELRNISSSDQKISVELRSGFSGFFNYHFGHTLEKSKISTIGVLNEFNKGLSFVNFLFSLNKNVQLTVKGQRYSFNSSESKRSFEFVDFDFTYKIRNSNWLFGLSGNNLLNVNSFESFRVTDLGSNTISYRLLPRFALIKMEYRF